MLIKSSSISYISKLLTCCINSFEQEEGADITANSVHPGVITTNLFRHLGIFEGNLGIFEGKVISCVDILN